MQKSKTLKDVPVVIMSSENVPSRINSCLEEGAEEFFLKPVRLSDVNKLKPHMMKGKAKEEQPKIYKIKASMKENQSPNKSSKACNVLEMI